MRSGKLILLIAALVFSFLKVNSQAPGYMGKKITAGYGFHFNPAFSNFLLDYADSPINTLHEFFVEGATRKKTMLGFSVKLYKYTYNNIEFVNAENYNGYYSQIDVRPQGTYLIRGKNFELYAKFFKSQYLAPWGKYFRLGLSYNSYETVYNPNVMRVQVRDYRGSVPTTRYISDFGPLIQSYNYLDICFGNGSSRIFGNRIVLDYGYNINLIAMSRMALTWLLDDYSYDATDEYIKNTSAKRVAAVNRFNFYFKLGYLF